MSDLSNKMNVIQNARDDIKSAILSKGQTVTNDIRTFANAVLNINGGGPVVSGIKQFSSIESMQADLNPFNDGLAIVYLAEQGRFTEESEIQFVSFPDTVTLPEAVGEEDEYYVTFIPVDEESPLYVEGTISLSVTFVSCEFYSDNMAYSIYYESEDGINYVKTDSYDAATGEQLSNPINLKIPLKINEDDYEWSDSLTYFMYKDNYDFEGLFQYNGTNSQYELAPTQLDANKANVYGQTFYGPKGVEQGTLSRTTDLNSQQLYHQVGVYNDLSELSVDSNEISTEAWFMESNISTTPRLNLSNVKNLKEMFRLCENLTDVAVMDLSSATNIMNMFQQCPSLTTASYCNIANSLPLASQLDNGLFTNIGINVSDLSDEAKDILFEKGYLDCDYNFDGWSTSYNINGVEVSRGDDYDRYGQVLCNYINNTLPFSVQDVTIESIGNDDGILLVADNMCATKRRLKNANILINTSNILSVSRMFYDCQNLKSITNFDTSNVKNFSNMFTNCQNLTEIPNYNLSSARDIDYMLCNMVNITTIPNFDISNVTDMAGVFRGCRNLSTVPNFNTSNVSNMLDLFESCLILTDIPHFDTSNVIDMSSMVRACTNLTIIPNFDTSNVKSMSSMFSGCSNLTTIPEFDMSNVTNVYSMFEFCNNMITAPNLNTSNVTIMGAMFSNCFNLSDVPQYITTNVNNIRGMFERCNNLSNASVQNIVNMCLASNIAEAEYMNLNPSNTYSPLYSTIFDSSYYSNRLDELLTAGWTY